MPTATEPTTELAELKPSQLAANPKNIRRDVGDISTLVDSISAQGIRHPLVVAPNGKPDKYIVIAGHRRLAAAKKLRLKTVPCIVDTAITDEADQVAAMLAENIERQDLTAVEEADGVALLLDLGLNQKQIASRTGMTSPRVRSRLKVAKLSDDVKTRITDHEVTLADAVFIADHAGNPADLAELENALGTNNWAVAKQQQLDRVAERKRVASIRKDAEAAGFDIVTDWGRRRELNAAAAATLKVNPKDLVHEEFAWPASPEVFERAKSDATVAFLHLSESKSLMAEHKWVGEVLVVLSAPEAAPTSDGNEPAHDNAVSATDSAAATADTAPDADADDPGSLSEQQAAENARALARRDALKAAATVRTEWVRELIAAGDDEAAMKATAVAVEHSPGGFGEFNFGDAGPFLSGVEDFATGSGREDAARAWFSTNKPASVLLALLWGLVLFEPAQALVNPASLVGSDLTDLRFVVAYGELLADLGYVLSDVEAGVLDQVRADIAEITAEEASDED